MRSILHIHAASRWRSMPAACSKRAAWAIRTTISHGETRRQGALRGTLGDTVAAPY